MKAIVSNSEECGRWVAKKIFGTWKGDPTIGLTSDGEMVAGVIYENWNGKSITCHIAVQGLMTPKYLAAIFHYPFVHLGCDTIICTVAESNEESIRLAKKLGFQEHARLPEAHPDGAVLIFMLYRRDCRFIGERYGKRLLATACA